MLTHRAGVAFSRLQHITRTLQSIQIIQLRSPNRNWNENIFIHLRPPRLESGADPLESWSKFRHTIFCVSTFEVPRKLEAYPSANALGGEVEYLFGFSATPETGSCRGSSSTMWDEGGALA